MSIKQWNAGIIRPIPVAPTGPYQDGAAPGVWTLAEAAYWQKQGKWPIAGNLAPRGLFAGGGYSQSISYFSIASTGNGATFGNLTNQRTSIGACASSSRAVFAAGYNDSSYVKYNIIDYVTIATTGNASDFGDLSQVLAGIAGCSNSTRGLFAGGENDSTRVNVIQYITIATTGNATDFGDLLSTNYQLAACSSTTRGIFAGGQQSYSSTFYNVIQYVTIASAGDAADFGDLTVTRSGVAGCSSSTRGVFASGQFYGTGWLYYNTIDYITIASTGNATDFGDLSYQTASIGACSSQTIGVFGGNVSGTLMQYVTIATTGNAVNFGDLPVGSIYGCAATSGVHGGL